MFDIYIYMMMSVNDAHKMLSQEDSPMKFESSPFPDYFIYLPKDQSLTGNFGLGEPDSEGTLGDELIYELKFEPNSVLLYNKVRVYNHQKGSAFRNIADYFSSKNIPFYMILEGSEGPHLLIGANPEKGIYLEGLGINDNSID